MRKKISTDSLLDFIDQRKKMVAEEYYKNTDKAKLTNEPEEIIQLNHSNSRLFGRQKELTVLTGFVVNNSEADGKL